MSAAGGGEPPPPHLSEEEEAFWRLISSQGKRIETAPPPKFVKKLEAVPEIALPEEKSIRIAVSLAERALVGQFTGL